MSFEDFRTLGCIIFIGLLYKICIVFIQNSIVRYVIYRGFYFIELKTI